MKKLCRKRIIIPAVLIVGLIIGFFCWAGCYYHADATAVQALASGDGVSVSQTDYDWFFDGPSTDRALLFFPGAKVEETAYAPFVRRLAQAGMDVCLLKEPFHLAVFDNGRAAAVMDRYDYAHWYVGGHSLGGAIAAQFAEVHGDRLDGVILCAAYLIKRGDEDLTEIVLCGSEDGIINTKRMRRGDTLGSRFYFTHVIDGGNHAQFGNYGLQRGDGTATISAEAQQEEAVAVIMDTLQAEAEGMK
ncbi:MAG: alpha/beta hydrolase [Lachnospiraceae bacterium]|nr:alpha/beta hydrolase [Lachnospiraceae bacterium]